MILWSLIIAAVLAAIILARRRKPDAGILLTEPRAKGPSYLAVFGLCLLIFWTGMGALLAAADVWDGDRHLFTLAFMVFAVLFTSAGVFALARALAVPKISRGFPVLDPRERSKR